MANPPLISIIVPFFNIKEYVVSCIESLENQDFESYEIICVDDGSHDGTSEILDAISSKYQNIIVLHTDNNGVSEARNIGVAHAHGEYITFVDGDDIVSPFYLDSLYSIINDDNCDLAIGRFEKIRFRDISSKKVNWKKPSSRIVLSRTELIDDMLYENLLIASWAHLCKKDIYINHPFTPGRIFEDSLSLKDHVLWASVVGVIKEPIYGYSCRRGSITDPSNVTSEKLSQLEQMLEKLEFDIKTLNEDHKEAWLYHLALEYSRLARLIKTSGTHTKITLEEINAFIKLHYDSLMGNSHISKKTKLRFFLLRYCGNLYYSACNFYDRLFY